MTSLVRALNRLSRKSAKTIPDNKTTAYKR
jgi:hypothetical protein